MSHTCHWTNCSKRVPPSMWGCKEHWFTLPKFLRDQVWKAYVPGQEITKTPSLQYVLVAKLVELWILNFEATGEGLTEKEFVGPFMEKVRAAGEAVQTGGAE